MMIRYLILLLLAVSFRLPSGSRPGEGRGAGQEDVQRTTITKAQACLFQLWRPRRVHQNDATCRRYAALSCRWWAGSACMMPLIDAHVLVRVLTAGVPFEDERITEEQFLKSKAGA